MGFPTFVADHGCVSSPPNMMIHMALDWWRRSMISDREKKRKTRWTIYKRKWWFWAPWQWRISGTIWIWQQFVFWSMKLVKKNSWHRLPAQKFGSNPIISKTLLLGYWRVEKLNWIYLGKLLVEDWKKILMMMTIMRWKMRKFLFNPVSIRTTIGQVARVSENWTNRNSVQKRRQRKHR